MGGTFVKYSSDTDVFYSADECSESDGRQRELSWMVPRSDDPCMIMCSDDEERARMSCGHAISEFLVAYFAVENSVTIYITGYSKDQLYVCLLKYTVLHHRYVFDIVCLEGV